MIIIISVIVTIMFLYTVLIEDPATCLKYVSHRTTTAGLGLEECFLLTTVPQHSSPLYDTVSLDGPINQSINHQSK